jgi:hypothetical protein
VLYNDTEWCNLGLEVEVKKLIKEKEDGSSGLEKVGG